MDSEYIVVIFLFMLLTTLLGLGLYYMEQLTIRIFYYSIIGFTVLFALFRQEGSSLAFSTILIFALIAMLFMVLVLYTPVDDCKTPNRTTSVSSFSLSPSTSELTNKKIEEELRKRREEREGEILYDNNRFATLQLSDPLHGLGPSYGWTENEVEKKY